jgi:Phosphodiester glycosidase
MPAHSRRRGRPHYFIRRVAAVILVLIVVVVALVGVSLVGALRTPGNQGFDAKWADWLRSHHMARLANDIETYYYQHHVPRRGGQPAHLNAVPTPPTTAPVKRTIVVVPHLRAPAPVPLVVSPHLPGEGLWRPADVLVHGIPAMYVAQFRADAVYTSQITSAVWIDPTLLRVSLVPGSQEPGGTWPQPPDIQGPALRTAMAAFNGGFRSQDAHGGFYLNGRTAEPLQAGAESLLIYANGRVAMGTWGQEVAMRRDVTAVLQNLVPIVDNGQPAPDATYHDSQIWGATLGANTVVARSGLGVTASGALVYVAGPALTARSLAESLQRAGAVRAMTLDINPEWVTFNFYAHSAANPSLVTPSKLYPQMQRPANRYLGPQHESRDFFLVSMPA